MKKLNLTLALLLFGSLIYNKAKAQVHVGIGLNFGSPVYYAPAPVVVERAPVYEEHYYKDDDDDEDEDHGRRYYYNDYYYMPDVDAYYSVGRRCYYYNNGGAWVSATYLPGAYRNYSWRTARRYEVHAYRPYLHNVVYREKFGGRHDNGNHNGWYKHGHEDRGEHRGWYR
ncbi:MAG TPA: hypothetical protein VNW51_08320 [Mucilaginibacter sp.]|nr:hypothetical protein [Mucilaginibacter sp.]